MQWGSTRAHWRFASANYLGFPGSSALCREEDPNGHDQHQRGMFYGPDGPFGGYKARGVGRMDGLETKVLARPSLGA